MDEATREALTAQFRAYLDTVADDSSGPDDEIDAMSAPDLFSLFSELAALKNEVKLESRQVKGALDEFRGLFDHLRETQTRLGNEQERRCEQSRAADRAGWRDMLLELLELRDRLQAGQEQAARFRPHWYGRNRREAKLIVTLAEGMAMNLRRLEETLARREVRPIPTIGRLFDPHRMHAAELTRDPQYRHGEVMAELRPGWLLHDELLRLAEVVVNRIDVPNEHSPKPTETLS
ncbi:nucleotide exchange factor GrpE [Thiorhodovibrio winogradskyi]|nr:nucleotide exchange factor GrpE [Thiorhodovibrio winogradskyi]